MNTNWKETHNPRHHKRSCARFAVEDDFVVRAFCGDTYNPQIACTCGGAALPAEHAPPEPSEAAVLAAVRAVFERRDFPTTVHSGAQRGNFRVDLSEIKADVQRALRAAYAVDRGVSPPSPQPITMTWETAPAALKQIRADAVRLGKAGERIVLLVDTLVPRVQQLDAGEVPKPPRPAENRQRDGCCD